ncbi:hypothetical protein ACM66B_002496 [Microbotryomycetes sp. NB124-2]
MRSHPVFHMLLLEPYWTTLLASCQQVLPPPLDILHGEVAYVVSKILDSCWRGCSLQYFVNWEGYGPEERSWTRTLVFDNNNLLVLKFHQRHPTKPGFQRIAVLQSSMLSLGELS